MFKRILIVCLAVLIFALPVRAKEIKKPEITSEAYVLYNPDNDEVVESQNGKSKMYPASLTKMLTALVAYEMCDNLDGEVITVSKNAITSIYGTSSSKAGLKVGEQVSVKQMLYLLLLPSGNDAANALAEHFCGDNDTFAKKMNEKAKEIGMKNSNFVNPHGLHNKKHYTTAEDLALLADAYSDVKLLKEIAECNQYFMPATNKQGERIINTTNLMKIENSGYYYEYTKGLKTGNTDEAGRCLAASAEKNGERFIVILLNCPEKWYGKSYWRCEFLEAADIFEYAFENYDCVKVANKGDKLGENKVFETYGQKVDIILEKDVYATLKKGTDLSKIKVNYVLNKLNKENLLIPTVKNGDVLGNAQVFLNGKKLGQANVIAANTVRSHWWLKFWHKIDSYVYITVSVILGLALLIITLIIRKKIVVYKRKKEKQNRLERRKKLQEEFDSKPAYDYYKMD